MQISKRKIYFSKWKKYTQETTKTTQHHIPKRKTLKLSPKFSSPKRMLIRFGLISNSIFQVFLRWNEKNIEKEEQGKKHVKGEKKHN